MDGITLSFTDARPVLAPGALEEQVRAAAPLLAEAAAGEERYRDNLGWHSVDEAAGPERVDFLLEQAARVRADADAFVVIGIGGSNQASRAAVKALRPEGGPAILWAGNTISACEMARTLRELDGYQSIYIDCIAKNFETLEPGIAFRVLRQYLERRYGAEGAAKRIFATGTPGSTLHQLCLDQGYTFLTFPETIGGRYSVGSDVGLFPMAVAGVDIRALVQGMRDMRDTLLAAPAEENPALRYACLRRLLLEHGYRLEMLSFLNPGWITSPSGGFSSSPRARARRATPCTRWRPPTRRISTPSASSSRRAVPSSSRPSWRYAPATRRCSCPPRPRRTTSTT